MAQFDIKSLTAIGANNLARALNGERITWDYMQASTDYFYNDVANLTTLTNVIKNLNILSAKQVADGQFDVTSRISSTDVNKQTTIRTYGLFAHFNAETPALVAIISDKNGDVLYPVSQTTNPQDLQQTMSLVFPNPDGKPIPYVISGSGYAMDTEVLHKSNDETSTGTKTFQRIKISSTKFPSLVQTDGKSITLDGGNSEIVPADNSKVIHSTDMRKPASDVAGIEEVNAKQDKIGYTPADDSKVTHNSSDDAISYGNNNIFNLRTKLSSQDDIFKITQEGLFQANNTAPANNPWGVGNPISGDCLSLWWSFIFVDNNGEVYVATPNTKKWDKKVSENGTNNFHGKNTFDTAPIDKTTGNPYITSDGVPKVDTSKLVTTDGSGDGTIQNAKLSVKDGQLFVNGYPVLGYGTATGKDDATQKSGTAKSVLFTW